MRKEQQPRQQKHRAQVIRERRSSCRSLESIAFVPSRPRVWLHQPRLNRRSSLTSRPASSYASRRKALSRTLGRWTANLQSWRAHKSEPNGIGNSNEGYKALREKLIQEGTVSLTSDGLLRFAHSRIFASPSAAGAVIVGRSANGRTLGKLQGTRMTYGTWQNHGLEDASGAQQEQATVDGD
jgi:hypothetical protein